MKRILLFFILILVSAVPSSSRDWKTRKQLQRENRQLRERIEALEQEIAWYQNDINERDSLRRELLDVFEENENKMAQAMTPSDYTPSQEVTDSLLSIWYLHRQSRRSKEGEYNMDSVKFTTNVPDTVLMGRLSRMNSFIRLPYNETVKNYMILYSEKMPVKMGQILGLSTYYMPIFEETFRKYNLPLELRFMAIIESALNPLAVSWAGATGMWQFMYNTARNYGLKIDSYVDERLDPYASADAAARYLQARCVCAGVFRADLIMKRDIRLFCNLSQRLGERFIAIGAERDRDPFTDFK